MEGDAVRSCAMLPPEGWSLAEGAMIQEDRWKEIRRLSQEERVPIAVPEATVLAALRAGTAA